MSICAQIDQYSLSLSESQNYQSSMDLICTTLILWVILCMSQREAAKVLSIANTLDGHFIPLTISFPILCYNKNHALGLHQPWDILHLPSSARDLLSRVARSTLPKHCWALHSVSSRKACKLVLLTPMAFRKLFFSDRVPWILNLIIFRLGPVPMWHVV